MMPWCLSDNLSFCVFSTYNKKKIVKGNDKYEGGDSERGHVREEFFNISCHLDFTFVKVS